MAMYSRFHSFTPSQVWGYRLTGKSVEWVSLKDRETAEETLAFWGN